MSPEDRALWAKVAKTLTPLHPQKAIPEPVESAVEAPIEKQPDATTNTSTAIRPPEPGGKPPAPPPLRRMENRHRRKLVRGVNQIDARIDLHGLTQYQAHDRLRGFLYEAQARGHKVVLVITGKGAPGTGFMEERGVLRRVVPQWLAMPDMRSLVIGYEEAHVTHGGTGALYVRIRRRR
nr:Smr/MutS family protein [Roseibium sp. RKSG952]